MRELKQNWKDLFGGFRIAFDLWKIALAFMGIALTVLVLVVCNKNNLDPRVVIGVFAGLLVVGVVGVLLSAQNKSSKPLSSKKTIAFLILIAVIIALAVLFASMDALHGGVLSVIRALLVLALWALFGGAIVRIAAVEIATDDRIGLGEALRFAGKRYREYILAPILAIVFIGILGLLIYVGMLVSAIPYLGTCFLVFFIFPLVILAGFIITLVFIGLWFGFPLMWPTISAEGSDAFDALSRAYSYLYSRPWRWIWYNLVALGYFVAILLFVSAFFRFSVNAMERFSQTPGIRQAFPHVRRNVEGMLAYAVEPIDQARMLPLDMLYPEAEKARPSVFMGGTNAGSLLTGEGEVFVPLTGHQTVAKVLMSIWLYVYTALFVAFLFSLAFCLNTIIYFLLRKDVDGTDMTEVFIEEEEEEAPAASGFDTETETTPAEEEETADKSEAQQEAAEEETEDDEGKGKSKKKK